MANLKSYFIIRIPFVPPLFATRWHPTEPKGNLSVLTRGAFDTETEALNWAIKELDGTPYQIQYVELDDWEAIEYRRRARRAK